MDNIWKVAQHQQESRHQAIGSMDLEEGSASSRTTSCWMSGFTLDNVLGRRWYDMEEAAAKGWEHLRSASRCKISFSEDGPIEI